MAVSLVRSCAARRAPADSRSSAPTTRRSVTSSSTKIGSSSAASTTRPTSSRTSPSPRPRRSRGVPRDPNSPSGDASPGRTLMLVTGRRSSLCPRCGGVTYEQIDERHSRCADCGLRRTSQPLVLRPENDRASTENRRPDTRLVELAERMRGNFEKAGFPGYGLDDRWLGTRWFGGSGGSGNRIDRLELAHGENPWDPEDAQIRVERIRPRKVLH